MAIRVRQPTLVRRRKHLCENKIGRTILATFAQHLAKDVEVDGTIKINEYRFDFNRRFHKDKARHTFRTRPSSRRDKARGFVLFLSKLDFGRCERPTLA